MRDSSPHSPMRIITTDDFVETYAKGVQRGFGFLASKFRISNHHRTLSAFDDSAANASNWWMIPAVRRRLSFYKNRALSLIPKSYRRRYYLSFYKNRVSGPGMLRMILADPSEARESARILETLGKYLVPAEVKPYGGNVLMLTMKDIAHHFMEETPESIKILHKLFELEDEYLRAAKSDFVFAVYRKRM